MKISVALAACNGEKYITEQINSILSELGPGDEIVISDDNPGGKTAECVRQIADSRIKYIEGPGKGVTENFENALKNTDGDIIFLCDQDDVWLPGKVNAVLDEFSKGSNLVLHNAKITDAVLNETGKTVFELYHPTDSFLKNLLSNSFVGCCMAFDKSVLDLALPIPGKAPMHDWYIALAAMLRGKKISFIDEPLMLWRRHDANVTGKKTTFAQKLKFRINMIGSILTVCHGKDKR